MIGERLAEVRKDHKDTQADLANKLGVTLSTVRSWEQEKSSPAHELLVNICKLYNVSSDYLLGILNIDPIYDQKRRQTIFNEDELIEIKKFEEYLLWKQNRK